MSSQPPVSSQAEQMIRRVSPEGRARARREQQIRQRATIRLIVRVVLAGLAILLAAWLVNDFVTPIGIAGIGGAAALFAIAAIAIAFLSRTRAATASDLAQSTLDVLPGLTACWLDQRRDALPHAATALLDSIGVRLNEMTPQLERITLDGPAAFEVRKLVSADLPALVQGYLDVPASLRGQTLGASGNANQHLVEGLGVIESEIGRMNEQLARGAFDELAIQRRFLEIKYDVPGDLA